MKVLPDAVNSPAWLHGVSVFTTVRTRKGAALDWPAHLERLRASCAALHLPEPSGTLPALEALPWGLARVTVTPEGTFMSHRALAPGPRPEAGVRLTLTGVQVHPQLARHKTGNYLPYRLAAREAAQGGAFEGWLLDAAGHVVDGSRTSPLLAFGEELVVPAGGLPGVTRAAFLTGRAFTERPVPAAELATVTAAWVCGSGVGMVPVAELALPGGLRYLPVHWPATRDARLIWPGDP